MELGFLFWLFFIGIFIATLQDLKRREVDNWLNLLLVFSSVVYLVYTTYFNKNFEIIFIAGFVFILMFVFMNSFYYGRVFAGGDAKLLFAMSVFFVSSDFYLSLFNIIFFLVLLMVCGSIYGLFYSGVLYVMNFKKVNLKLKKEINPRVKYLYLGGFVFLIFGFFETLFLIFGLVFLILPFIYSFAKALEGVVMVREIKGTDLREGDWLSEDITLGKKTIKANWEGLTKKELILLRKLKKVKIREGLPFVPAFLMAFLIYVFLRGHLISFLRF